MREKNLLREISDKFLFLCSEYRACRMRRAIMKNGTEEKSFPLVQFDWYKI